MRQQLYWANIVTMLPFTLLMNEIYSSLALETLGRDLTKTCAWLILYHYTVIDMPQKQKGDIIYRKSTIKG
jgi:hypothetical protein